MVTGKAARPTMEAGATVARAAWRAVSGRVDAEQLAALRRLRAAFGHVEVLAVHADDEANSEEPAYGQGELEEHDARPARDAPGRSSPRRGSCAAR